LEHFCFCHCFGFRNSDFEFFTEKPGFSFSHYLSASLSFSSGHDFDIVGLENGISSDDPKAMYLGSGNDHAIAGILVDRWQPGRLDADVKIQGKHLKAVMVNNGSEPFGREGWKHELSFFVLDAKLKTADSRDIDKRGHRPVLEGLL
jgi:hypothetical protein